MSTNDVFTLDFKSGVDIVADFGDKKYFIRPLVLRKIIEGIAYKITDGEGKILADIGLDGAREDVK